MSRNIAKYSEMKRNITKYNEIQRNTAKYREIKRNIAKYNEIKRPSLGKIHCWDLVSKNSTRWTLYGLFVCSYFGIFLYFVTFLTTLKAYVTICSARRVISFLSSARCFSLAHGYLCVGARRVPVFFSCPLLGVSCWLMVIFVLVLGASWFFFLPARC